jgi:pimeloyl-ACP methyl ester carboxylesterase
MRVILEHKRVDGIPLIEYYKDKDVHKGLVFVQHGYESTKEQGADYLAIQLARDGFFVVAIDAWKHGERIAEPYVSGSAQERLDEAFVVVKRTALDIIRLHRTHYLKRFDVFDVVGVSLGGMMAFYLATKTKRVKRLVPVISTPDFLAQAYHAVAGAGIDTTSFFTQDKLDFIAAIDPLRHVDTMHYESLHVFAGTKDNVVPMDAVVTFYDEHKTERDTIEVYDVGHTVCREMQAGIRTVLQS